MSASLGVGSPARVGVEDHDASGAAQQALLEDLARLDVCAMEGAAKDLRVAEDTMADVQEELSRPASAWPASSRAVAAVPTPGDSRAVVDEAVPVTAHLGPRGLENMQDGQDADGLIPGEASPPRPDAQAERRGDPVRGHKDRCNKTRGRAYRGLRVRPPRQRRVRCG